MPRNADVFEQLVGAPAHGILFLQSALVAQDCADHAGLGAQVPADHDVLVSAVMLANRRMF